MIEPMSSFLRRVPNNALLMGLYLLLVAFAVIAWRNSF
jgi:hypothetical protein